MGSVRLRRGKADFLKRKLPGKDIETVCLCTYNADLSVRGCIAQVPGELLKEVVKNNGQYLESTLNKFRHNGKRLPDARCSYCYAKRHNYGKVTSLEVDEKTKEDFETYKPEFVRLGKNSEVGHIFYRETLKDFLSLCEEYNVKIILPTKMLDFDCNLAKKLLNVGGIINYSIGYNRFESGAFSQGFTNEWRIKQAEKYLKEGVNTTLTIVCDITSSIDENVERGSSLKEALNSPVLKRIIPIRLNSKLVAKKIIGITWDDLVNHVEGQDTLRGFEKHTNKIQSKLDKSPYFLKSNGLGPSFFHPDFRKFKEEIQVCGRIGEEEYCDKCTLL
ncbi:hypothetical protein CMI39_03345 [Candidatus Pacearchaeota archaeon]|mgnify:CR=1 FL=1|jgi:hypothetical protein|nr:hypothetical protein [Candidatus Pacearchaeota archaeon]|tara:strand:- start:1277 stop:2272 length:996 start_codon:yes stop_codon:yes gene_type:complete